MGRSCLWNFRCSSFILLAYLSLDRANYNDIWRFDGDNWAYISGPTIGGDAGSFGTLNVPSPSNLPAARVGVSSCQIGGKFYMFFGLARDGSTHSDAWLYQPYLDITYTTSVSSSSLTTASSRMSTFSTATSPSVTTKSLTFGEVSPLSTSSITTKSLTTGFIPFSTSTSETQVSGDTKKGVALGTGGIIGIRK